MFTWCRKNPTAQRIAAAFRSGALSQVIIDPQPRSDPRYAYPRMVLFSGVHAGKQWIITSTNDLIVPDTAAPVTMNKLFTRVAHGDTGEGLECARKLRRHRRRWGLRVLKRPKTGVIEISKAA